MKPQQKTRHSKVIDLVKAALKDDPGFAEDLADQIQQRQLVRKLATMRNAKGISQAEMAQHLGCGQSRISKLENGYDADLTLRDLKAYAKALDCDLQILLRSTNSMMVGELL